MDGARVAQDLAEADGGVRLVARYLGKGLWELTLESEIDRRAFAVAGLCSSYAPTDGKQ